LWWLPLQEAVATLPRVRDAWAIEEARE